MHNSPGESLDGLINKFLTKSPLRNAILNKYSNLNKTAATLQSQAVEVKLEDKHTDTADLPLHRLSSPDALQLLGDKRCQDDSLALKLAELMTPADLAATCVAMRGHLQLSQQTVLDLQNQVKFFKGLVKHKNNS